MRYEWTTFIQSTGRVMSNVNGRIYNTLKFVQLIEITRITENVRPQSERLSVRRPCPVMNRFKIFFESILGHSSGPIAANWRKEMTN